MTDPGFDADRRAFVASARTRDPRDGRPGRHPATRADLLRPRPGLAGPRHADRRGSRSGPAGDPRALARVRDIRKRDRRWRSQSTRWDENWTRLAGSAVSGERPSSIRAAGHADAVDALRAKYQRTRVTGSSRPVIRIAIEASSAGATSARRRVGRTSVLLGARTPRASISHDPGLVLRDLSFVNDVRNKVSTPATPSGPMPRWSRRAALLPGSGPRRSGPSLLGPPGWPDRRGHLARLGTSSRRARFRAAGVGHRRADRVRRAAGRGRSSLMSVIFSAADRDDRDRRYLLISKSLAGRAARSSTGSRSRREPRHRRAVLVRRRRPVPAAPLVPRDLRGRRDPVARDGRPLAGQARTARWVHRSNRSRGPAVGAFLDVDADRVEQPLRCGRDLGDRRVECVGVSRRGRAIAADLADVLAGGGLQFARRGRGVGPTKGLDASAHARTVPRVRGRRVSWRAMDRTDRGG